MSFLHGVETLSLQSGTTPINNKSTAVIGLIGTSEAGSPSIVNKLKLCLSDVDDAQFGTTGSIPAALAAIRLQGPATVLVVSLGPSVSSPAYPVASDFVGTYANGVRTGLKLFDEAMSTFGFRPKIIIAPEYSSLTGMLAALQTVATAHRGCCYIDSAAGQSVNAAITARSAQGIWVTADPRTKLLFGGVKNIAGTVKPSSAYLAGLRARVDNELGFWFSSSNNEIKGIIGLETPISFAINDLTSEANTLNAAGIVALVTLGGYKEWGNRNAAYPTLSTVSSFEAVQRLDDITSEAIELAMAPYLDKPINQALIDFILNSVNGYFNELIAKGALIEGSKCYFLESKNSETEIAAGHLTFTKKFIGGIPGERFTFENYLDTAILQNLL
jgi:phage tail sheath protein FI